MLGSARHNSAPQEDLFEGLYAVADAAIDSYFFDITLVTRVMRETYSSSKVLNRIRGLPNTCRTVPPCAPLFKNTHEVEYGASFTFITNNKLKVAPETLRNGPNGEKRPYYF